MKALSIQQPWAWLIVNGYKDIENRDWPTRYTGPLLIHAGKQYDAAGEHWVRRTFPSIPLPGRAALQYGGIVGSANVVGCVTASSSEWFQGRYGFALNCQAVLPFRPIRGMLGLFDVPDAVRPAPTEEAK